MQISYLVNYQTDMEKQTIDRTIISPETRNSLGLDTTSGPRPRVLSLLASDLERQIKRDEKESRKMKKKMKKKLESITVFDGSRAPSLSIEQYVERIFKYSCCSPSCFVVAKVYIDRFLQRTGGFLTMLNVHRLLITTVMVAAKFIDDLGYNNSYFAKIGGVSLAEMNRLEMDLLFSVDFRLHVPVKLFRDYCILLQNECVNEYPIDRSLRDCRIGEKWSYSETKLSCSAI